MPILSPGISFFLSSPPLASKAESLETHRGRLSSPIASHLHPPRNYLAYLPTEPVLRGILAPFQVAKLHPQERGEAA